MHLFANVPDRDHFAVITEIQVKDPRYPESEYDLESVIKYESFEDRSSWEERISELVKENIKYKALAVRVAKVETNTVVRVQV